jgi:hypothetical protein
VQEADGSDLGIDGCTGTGVTEGGADRAPEDPEDGAGHVGVVVEVGAEALGEREHPTTCIRKRCPRTGRCGST